MGESEQFQDPQRESCFTGCDSEKALLSQSHQEAESRSGSGKIPSEKKERKNQGKKYTVESQKDRKKERTEKQSKNMKILVMF